MFAEAFVDSAAVVPIVTCIWMMVMVIMLVVMVIVRVIIDSAAVVPIVTYKMIKGRPLSAKIDDSEGVGVQHDSSVLKSSYRFQISRFNSTNKFPPEADSLDLLSLDVKT